jgi:hypothetical protein
MINKAKKRLVPAILGITLLFIHTHAIANGEYTKLNLVGLIGNGATIIFCAFVEIDSGFIDTEKITDYGICISTSSTPTIDNIRISTDGLTTIYMQQLSKVCGTIFSVTGEASSYTLQMFGFPYSASEVFFTRAYVSCQRNDTILTFYSNLVISICPIPPSLGYAFGGGDGAIDYGDQSHIILPQPIELTFFIATATPFNTTLQWKTATEVNNYGFDMERRQVGNSGWAKIAFVQGNGTSNIEHAYTYTDKCVSSGSYIYRLKQIDNDGTYKYSQETEVTVETPGSYALNQNYPNPFNPSTVISYSLPVTGAVLLKVYDVLGREVATLVNGTKEAGHFSVVWNASTFSSGMYFYKLTAGNYTCTKEMVLIK